MRCEGLPPKKNGYLPLFGKDMQSASPTGTRYFGMSPRGEIADPRQQSNHKSPSRCKEAGAFEDAPSSVLLLFEDVARRVSNPFGSIGSIAALCIVWRAERL